MQSMQCRNKNLEVDGIPTSPDSTDFILEVETGLNLSSEVAAGCVALLLSYPLYTATVAVLWVMLSKWVAQQEKKIKYALKVTIKVTLPL